MAWIMFILFCIFISFIVVKFSRIFVSLIGILGAVAILGLVIMPINLDLGLIMTIHSIVYIAAALIISMVSGIISAIVVGPLVLLWASIKSLFNK